MGALAGPTAVTTNGQITIPKALLDQLGLQKGSRVMFRISDEDPRTLMIVPYDLFERRYQRGETLERLERLSRASQPNVVDNDATGE